MCSRRTQLCSFEINNGHAQTVKIDLSDCDWKMTKVLTIKIIRELDTLTQIKTACAHKIELKSLQ